MRGIACSILLLAVAIAPFGHAASEERLKPFILAATDDGELADVVKAVQTRLSEGGFELMGDYSPLPETHVVVATSDRLKAVAAGTPRGAYGSVVRIGIAVRDGTTQVTYVNPRYVAEAYRMAADLSDVAAALEAALGAQEAFGADGLRAQKLRRYTYMFGMEAFDDVYELGTFVSHDAAVAAVEDGFATSALGKVYRLAIPGTDQVVYGVALTADDEDARGSTHMTTVDTGGHTRIAYLPYEILVQGNRVEALHLRFRMAVHFPDLGMGTFLQLRSAPAAVERALAGLVTP